MTFYSAEMEGATTIGEILRETRVRRGLDLVTVAEETKISSRNLQAMEDGNLASLPAEVYTRGFYTMYARMLALDPGEVLEMYTRERNKLPKTAIYSTPPPNRLAQDMASMAERPTSLPSSYFGLIIFLFLLFGAFLCWYFGWNPASYLSEKLRSLEGSQRLEQVRNEESGPEFIFDAVVPEPPIKSESISLFSPTTVTAATTQPVGIIKDPVTSAVRPKYVVNAVFVEETPLSLQVDNQPQQTLSYKTGEAITWQAGEKLIVKLPGDTRTRLTLNDIPLKLPKAANNSITLSIPEDILR
ncbi:MAG TPA: hypothetical protein DDY32_17950 [Desulfobulbaceae bacterium]|nr:hypothetical protein [Desulfobulbaceae bacterium]